MCKSQNFIEVTTEYRFYWSLNYFVMWKFVDIFLLFNAYIQIKWNEYKIPLIGVHGLFKHWMAASWAEVQLCSARIAGGTRVGGTGVVEVYA